MEDGRGDITQLLHEWRDGDTSAFERLVPLAYPQLRRIAASYVSAERQQRVQPTELVHELYLRLVDQHQANWKDRGHFFAFAARLMRMILIDEARRMKANKRGGSDVQVPLTPDVPWLTGDPDDLLAVDRALEKLADMDPRKVRVIELRCFLGCTANEAAEALGISKPTADRDFTMAKAWLYLQVKGEPSPAQ